MVEIIQSDRLSEFADREPSAQDSALLEEGGRLASERVHRSEHQQEDDKGVAAGKRPEQAVNCPPGPHHEGILAPGMHRLEGRLDGPAEGVDAQDGPDLAQRLHRERRHQRQGVQMLVLRHELHHHDRRLLHITLPPTATELQAHPSSPHSPAERILLPALPALSTQEAPRLQMGVQKASLRLRGRDDGDVRIDAEDQVVAGSGQPDDELFAPQAPIPHDDRLQSHPSQDGQRLPQDAFFRPVLALEGGMLRAEQSTSQRQEALAAQHDPGPDIDVAVGGPHRGGGGGLFPASSLSLPLPSPLRGVPHPADVLHLPILLASSSTALGVLSGIDDQEHLAAIGHEVLRSEVPEELLQHVESDRTHGEVRRGEERGQRHRCRLGGACPPLRHHHLTQPDQAGGALDQDREQELPPGAHVPPIRKAMLALDRVQDLSQERADAGTLSQGHGAVHGTVPPIPSSCKGRGPFLSLPTHSLGTGGNTQLTLSYTSLEIVEDARTFLRALDQGWPSPCLGDSAWSRALIGDPLAAAKRPLRRQRLRARYSLPRSPLYPSVSGWETIVFRDRK